MAQFSFSGGIKKIGSFALSSIDIVCRLLLAAAAAAAVIMAIVTMGTIGLVVLSIIPHTFFLTLTLGVMSVLNFLTPNFIRVAIVNVLPPLALRIIPALIGVAFMLKLRLRDLRYELLTKRNSSESTKDLKESAAALKEVIIADKATLRNDIAAINAVNKVDPSSKDVSVSEQNNNVTKDKAQLFRDNIKYEFIVPPSAAELKYKIACFPIEATMAMSGAALALSVVAPPFAAAGFVGSLVGPAFLAAVGEIAGSMAGEMIFSGYNRLNGLPTDYNLRQESIEEYKKQQGPKSIEDYKKQQESQQKPSHTSSLRNAKAA